MHGAFQFCPVAHDDEFREEHPLAVEHASTAGDFELDP